MLMIFAHIHKFHRDSNFRRGDPTALQMPLILPFQIRYTTKLAYLIITAIKMSRILKVNTMKPYVHDFHLTKLIESVSLVKINVESN